MSKASLGLLLFWWLAPAALIAWSFLKEPKQVGWLDVDDQPIPFVPAQDRAPEPLPFDQEAVTDFDQWENEVSAS